MHYVIDRAMTSNGGPTNKRNGKIFSHKFATWTDLRNSLFASTKRSEEFFENKKTQSLPSTSRGLLGKPFFSTERSGKKFLSKSTIVKNESGSLLPITTRTFLGKPFHSVRNVVKKNFTAKVDRIF